MRITLRIYNATGDDLSLVEKYNWDGEYDSNPPETIKANGEAVFDIANGVLNHTSGAFLYRVLNPSILDPVLHIKYDCMVAFSNPRVGQNKVLCKCRQQGYFGNEAMREFRSQVINSGTPFNRDVSGDVVVTTAAITREDCATCFVTIGKFVK